MNRPQSSRLKDWEDPPGEARPVARWWWPGGSVEAEGLKEPSEIDRQCGLWSRGGPAAFAWSRRRGVRGGSEAEKRRDAGVLRSPCPGRRRGEGK